MTKVQAIPDEFRGATPYLACRNASAAMEFYVRAFGARERMRLMQQDGRVGHVWMIAAPVENVPPGEMKRRADSLSKPT